MMFCYSSLNRLKQLVLRGGCYSNKDPKIWKPPWNGAGRVLGCILEKGKVPVQTVKVSSDEGSERQGL